MPLRAHAPWLATVRITSLRRRCGAGALSCSWPRLDERSLLRKPPRPPTSLGNAPSLCRPRRARCVLRALFRRCVRCSGACAERQDEAAARTGDNPRACAAPTIAGKGEFRSDSRKRYSCAEALP